SAEPEPWSRTAAIRAATNGIVPNSNRMAPSCRYLSISLRRKPSSFGSRLGPPSVIPSSWVGPSDGRGWRRGISTLAKRESHPVVPLTPTTCHLTPGTQHLTLPLRPQPPPAQTVHVEVRDRHARVVTDVEREPVTAVADPLLRRDLRRRSHHPGDQ